MNIGQDPIYDNFYPERYPWERVPNDAVRSWALNIRLTIERPLSLANTNCWPDVVEGLRMALRTMAREFEPVPNSDSENISN